MAWGMISDRIGREKTYSVAYLAITLGAGFSLHCKNISEPYSPLWVFHLLRSGIRGGRSFEYGYRSGQILRKPVWTDLWDSDRRNKPRGAAGPLVWGILFDLFSDYTPAIRDPSSTYPHLVVSSL